MEDLSKMLGDLMSSPDGMEKLSSLASMFLGGDGDGASADAPDREPGHKAGQDDERPAHSQEDDHGHDEKPMRDKAAPLPAPGGFGGFDLGGIDMDMIFKIQKAMSMMGEKDDNADLLLALKPHLSQARQGRVDEALKILKMMHMLPMIKESGLF